MSSLAILISGPLAFLFGFAAQRGNLCAVSAVNALIETRAVAPFLSLLRCSAWVMLVAVPVWWLSAAAHVSEIDALTRTGLAGAALFGAGAAINGGCNFGTLTRFAAGDASFAVTVAGGALGVWLERATVGMPAARPLGPTPLAHPAADTIALFAAVLLWCVIDLAVPGSAAASGCRRRLSWPRLGWARLGWTRLAPLVMGLTGGTLYLIDGGWAYTLDVWRLAGTQAAGELSGIALLGLTAATAAGAAVAAWRSGNFRPRLDPAVLPHRVGGGLLMGFGAALVPGGNAVLILHGIPAFSPHAAPDYLALCLGIALVLQVSRWLRTLARCRF